MFGWAIGSVVASNVSDCIQEGLDKLLDMAHVNFAAVAKLQQEILHACATISNIELLPNNRQVSVCVRFQACVSEIPFPPPLA